MTQATQTPDISGEGIGFKDAETGSILVYTSIIGVPNGTGELATYALGSEVTNQSTGQTYKKIHNNGNSADFDKIALLSEFDFETSIIHSLDGSGSVITTGTHDTGLVVPCGCAVTGWAIMADTVGIIIFDVWKRVFANYPPTVSDSILGINLPLLNGTRTAENLTMTPQWTLAKNDVVLFNVSYCSNITNCSLTLFIKKV